MRSNRAQIWKFSVKSDVIRMRYKVYTRWFNMGQEISDFHGVRLWYLFGNPNISCSPYIEIKRFGQRCDVQRIGTKSGLGILVIFYAIKSIQ